jgi:hypothetical protein
VGQLQVLDAPWTLLQTAMGLVSQPPLFVVHSLMSTQLPALPGVKPAGQEPHE